VGYRAGREEQQIESAYFLAQADARGKFDPRRALPLGKVAPVVLSEVRTDPVALAARAE
jgi:hypothetical protein